MTTTLKIVLAVILGVPLLLIASLCGAFTAPTYPSVKPWPNGTVGSPPYRGRVDEWSWTWLNYWYANSEDGVSGQQAYIWNASTQLVPYASTFYSWVPKWMIAFAWSAWRNNADNLKRPTFHADINKPWTP